MVDNALLDNRKWEEFMYLVIECIRIRIKLHVIFVQGRIWYSLN